MSKIKNVIKALFKKIILLLPNGNEMLAKAILFRNRLYSTPHNANVEVQTPANDPVNRKGLFTDYYGIGELFNRDPYIRDLLAAICEVESTQIHNVRGLK